MSFGVALLVVAVTGVALLALGAGVVRQWRRGGMAVWTVGVSAGLVLLGVCSWYASSVRVALVAAIYSNVYGQRSAPVPSFLISSWPLVATSSSAMAAVGGSALLAIFALALFRLRRRYSSA